MEPATREEINGLGMRVNSIERSVASCQGEKGQQILSLDTDMRDNKKSIIDIYKCMTELKVAMASMQNRIIGAVAVLIILINLVAPLIIKLIAKI